MAKFKPYNYDQMVMIPITLKEQLEPGTIEYAIHELVEQEIDLSIFEDRFKNDDSGAPAFDPKILLKIVLFAYSRGIIGSRPIERACQENIVFMALSCGFQPDHSTIAHFVSSMKEEIEPIFCNILLVCEELNLLGGTHFSLDGLKLPSNASKEWSGTFKELKKKRDKLQEKLTEVLSEHIRADETSASDSQRRQKQKKRLARQVERLDDFLKQNEPKKGKTKAEIQSNVTDNESAKMPTSHGVIQGYNAQALVDDKHQIIVNAEAMGNGQDHDNLKPMLEGAKKNMQTIGEGEDYFKDKELSADCNYHNKDNLAICEAEGINAYIPDPQFRKRDVRFAEQDRFKDGINPRKQVKKANRNQNTFTNDDFTWDEKKQGYICKNGKFLKRKARAQQIRNSVYDMYRAKQTDCSACPLRLKCLSTPQTQARYLLIPLARSPEEKKKFSLVEQMKAKIDTLEGRKIYSKRLATIEPVFANIRSQKRLDRFTLRTKEKVNIQWMLFALVHNIEKIAHYGMAH
ncbi:IS1182 family transposase [candidate division KSB1 bacterium]|nr:IS1182 family transposase [candidate division KSB1 bacterium]